MSSCLTGWSLRRGRATSAPPPWRHSLLRSIEIVRGHAKRVRANARDPRRSGHPPWLCGYVNDVREIRSGRTHYKTCVPIGIGAIEKGARTTWGAHCSSNPHSLQRRRANARQMAVDTGNLLVSMRAHRDFKWRPSLQLETTTSRWSGNRSRDASSEVFLYVVCSA